MKETGEDQESHEQTTSMSGCEILEGMVESERGRRRPRVMDRLHQRVDGKWEILEGMVEGKRDRGRRRVTWTDNINEWMGNIGGNGGG